MSSEVKLWDQSCERCIVVALLSLYACTGYPKLQAPGPEAAYPLPCPDFEQFLWPSLHLSKEGEPRRDAWRLPVSFCLDRSSFFFENVLEWCSWRQMLGEHAVKRLLMDSTASMYTQERSVIIRDKPQGETKTA